MFKKRKWKKVLKSEVGREDIFWVINPSAS